METPAQRRRNKRKVAAARLKAKVAAAKDVPPTPETGGGGASEEGSISRHQQLTLEGRAIRRRWPAQLETLKTRCLLETNATLMDPNGTRRDKIRAVANVIAMDRLEMEQERRNNEDPDAEDTQPVVTIQIVAPPVAAQVNGEAH